MKKYINWVLLATMIFMAACKKEELKSFEIKPAITFYKAGIEEGADSLTVSFAVKTDVVVKDTVELPIRIVGQVSDRDRSVLVKVDAEKTTASSDAYEIMPGLIPAGEHAGLLKIVLTRSAALKQKEARLWITLSQSDDFQVGPKELKDYLIKFNDFLTKPASWDQIRFGEFSQAKFGLIIRETGYSDFTGLRPDILLFIVSKCRLVLYDYEATNGTEMLDENRVPVRFP